MAKNILDDFDRGDLTEREKLQLAVARICNTSVQNARSYIRFTTSMKVLEAALKVAQDRQSKTLINVIKARIKQVARDLEKNSDIIYRTDL